MNRTLLLPLSAALLALPGCAQTPTDLSTGLSSFEVVITSVNGKALPSASSPLPPNYGDHDDAWGFTIQAKTPTGQDESSFTGTVRVSTDTGTVASVAAGSSPTGSGRNIVVTNGKASGTASVTAVFGPTRLWVEDIGYDPAPRGTTPLCASGKAVNAQGLVDYPANPGCAYADDNSDSAGTYAAGVSSPVQYALPKISDIHGHSSITPYKYQAADVAAAAPQHLIVTRVSSSGFYVTDIDPTEVASGYNSMFAFNFSTPADMRVCDHLTYLSGTVDEFFGFLEMDFPSWTIDPPHQGDTCLVPEPTVLTDLILNTPASMQQNESGLVRILGFKLPHLFGPKVALNSVFATDQSNCDYNGDGAIDYTNGEGVCSDNCVATPGCSEWTSFSAQNEVSVNDAAGSTIQLNLTTVPAFNPVSHRGEAVPSVTGTLRHFSGGKLNWTVEARCPDDLVCTDPACKQAVQSSQTACVRLRSIGDQNQGTN